MKSRARERRRENDLRQKERYAWKNAVFFFLGLLPNPITKDTELEAATTLLQQLKAREDPQEIAARSTEEERALVVRGLEKRLESSNLQELFTLEMTERQQQQQLEEQRQRLAMAQLEQQHQRMEDEASAQAQRSV